MDAATNPLLTTGDDPLALPAFAQIRAEHFGPALAHAMAAHRAEIAAIAGHAAPPDFDNTCAALDRAGHLLGRIQMVLYNLSASHTSPALQAVQRETAGPLAAHASAVLQDGALFARIDAVHRQRHQAALRPEQVLLVERQLRRRIPAATLTTVAAAARLSLCLSCGLWYAVSSFDAWRSRVGPFHWVKQVFPSGLAVLSAVWHSRRERTNPKHDGEVGCSAPSVGAVAMAPHVMCRVISGGPGAMLTRAALVAQLWGWVSAAWLARWQRA